MLYFNIASYELRFTSDRMNNKTLQFRYILGFVTFLHFKIFSILQRIKKKAEKKNKIEKFNFNECI